MDFTQLSETLQQAEWGYDGPIQNPYALLEQLRDANIIDKIVRAVYFDGEYQPGVTASEIANDVAWRVLRTQPIGIFFIQ